MSHELRTALTAISGWIQLIDMKFGNIASLSEALTNLRTAVAAEVKIVDDLLDLSRSERGSLHLVMQTFDLCEVLRSAAAFVTLQAENNSVGLEVEVPAEIMLLRGDPDRLRQVFVNLLTNGLKFTEEGKVALVARREGNRARVTVTDTGVGIGADFLPYVFEPFRRADRTESYPGLGIGLSIVRTLVEAHAGSIEVSSGGVNRGAQFNVNLPLLPH